MIHTGDHYEYLARRHRANEIRRVFRSLFQLPARLTHTSTALRRPSPSDGGLPGCFIQRPGRPAT